MYLIDLTSTDNGVKALRDSREVIAESTLDPEPLAFSQFFIFSEQVRNGIMNAIRTIAALARAAGL